MHSFRQLMGYMRPLSDSVAWIAGRQHGRISRRQLLAAGIDRDRIKRWIADGRLRRVHRGVYAVGHAAPSVLADCMAAVLRAGETAASSHWRRRTSCTWPRPRHRAPR
jgi:predicted transcriptional regulator of viral defense system